MNNEKLKSFLSHIILTALLIQITGCYVTKGVVPVVSSKQIEKIQAAMSLSIDLSHSFDQERSSGGQNQVRIDSVKEISKKVFNESGLFNSVDYNLWKSDLFLDFKVKETEKGSAESAAISGFTLLLVPVKSGTNFEVEAILKDKQGNVIGTYQSKGDFNIIFHLIFILPIGWRFNIPNQVYEAIFKDIVSQVSADRAKILMVLGKS